MKDLTFKRHRRLRQSATMRSMVKETYLHKEDFIYPIFVMDGENIKNEVSSMPGVFQFSIDRLGEEMDEVVSLGIPSVILFGLPAEKDEVGTQAFHNHGIVQEATRFVKKITQKSLLLQTHAYVNLLLMVTVASLMTKNKF